MNKPHTLLLDCDILRYELGSILSKGDTITIGGTKIDVPQSRAKVEELVKEKIDYIIERTGCTYVRGYLSQGKNFRFKRATIQPYKGNRKDFVKPYHWKTVGEVIRDYLENTIDCELFEADDHMAKDQDVDEGTTCIGSRDKDLRGRHGWHYSWAVGERSPEKPLQWIDKLEADRWFYTQCLTGDSTDNILGCAVKLPDKKGNPRRKGVGPKAAEQLLAEASSEQEMFNIVAAQYQLHCGNLWKEHMLENGTLLFMSYELIPWEELDSTKRLLENYERELYAR
ncbi:exonuclease [Vibrio phage vB_ValP_IME271]|nr:exonuclease [Vibrio phage vB_ValP_IME271]